MMGNEINRNEVFLNNDQPMTCPKCGRRTDIIFDLAHSIKQTQIHVCPSENCKFTIVSETDLEFEANNFSFERILLEAKEV